MHPLLSSKIADLSMAVEFFPRFTLEDKGFYPEIGDIIYHNDGYFEIDNVIVY